MSLLKEANKYYREGEYEKSVELYIQVLAHVPELKNILWMNLKLLEKKIPDSLILDDFQSIMNGSFIPKLIELKPIKKVPITALVITWDVGHNPLGRSYMLAEALEKSVRNVVLMGFQFPRFGDDIWEPVRNGNIPVITLPGKEMPELLNDFDKIVKRHKPDIVIACKPRLPSVELGLFFKEKHGIPLIIDVDDHELSFYGDAKNISINELLQMDKEKLSTDVEPYSKTWTQVTNDMCKFADEIIVSNSALKREFGGVIVPHVRNEEHFDSKLYSKTKQRSKYNLPIDAKIVMFFGTPRQHKGVNVIAEAIGQINDDKFILVVVGTAPDKSVTNKLFEISNGKTIFLPNQPFSVIPEIICMADVICLPQDLTNSISKYQLPAKAIDAIAMGIPLLVSPTEPLMQLVNDGVAKVLDLSNVASDIVETVNKGQNINERIKIRNRFLERYSYHSAASGIKTIIETVLKKPLKPLSDFKEFVDFQKNIFNVSISKSNEKEEQNKVVDIVLFWKQNDSGLYGRRSDMVIKYLAGREDVRKVIVFDAPISEYDLVKMKESGELTQNRKIYERTYEKLLSKHDSNKISFNVFAHPPGIYSYNDNDKNRKYIFEGYGSYISEVLEREGVVAKKSIFWFYPKNYVVKDILNYFKPKKVVVDVVDDHRAWPNVSEHEKKKLTEHYKYILSRADFAFANCQPVIDSMKQFKADIKLVPNGCEDNPEIIEPKNFEMYNELKTFKGKVIGFVGNLEAKIDIELIKKIAIKFPETLIVLVGSTHANPKTKELQKYSNIRMFGVVPYENINAIVSKFTVGIVPHIKMNLTNNMNPLKVFVYLANKVSVVASNVENIEESKLVKKAQNHDEFLCLLDDILSNVYQIDEKLFRKYIKDLSWAARLKKHISKLIKETIIYE